MADRNERWVMNHLIEMCRDDELALRFAAEHVQNQVARTLLTNLAERRAEFAEELLPFAQRLGGVVAGDGSTGAALHRGWLAVKQKLVGPSDTTMLDEAEHDERSMLAGYEDALNRMLPPTARPVIERQCGEIRMAHRQVQDLLPH